MRTPDEVRRILARRFDERFPSWARGGGTWPMRISLAPPNRQTRQDDPLACHTWAQQWREYDGPGRLDHVELRFPTGTHSMPASLNLETPHQVAAADPGTEHRWRTCGVRLPRLQKLFPGINPPSWMIKRLADLPETDFTQLVAVTTWLKENPASGMLIRQLPVEGVHTKWLAQHARLVLALLGDRPTDNVDLEDEDAKRSRRRETYRRLGLRATPELVQVAVLCPVLRTQIGGMRHFAGSIDDLNSWPGRPTIVLIIENKETAYALTEDMPGVVVLHGEGFDVASYARIGWARTAATVIYWGDLDLAGLHFLNDLRSYGLPAKSIMTNLPTFTRFRHLAVVGAALHRHDVPHLDANERELYEHLRDHAKTTGQGILLEQERIPWEHARVEIYAVASIDQPYDSLSGPEVPRSQA